MKYFIDKYIVLPNGKVLREFFLSISKDKATLTVPNDIHPEQPLYEETIEQNGIFKARYSNSVYGSYLDGICIHPEDGELIGEIIKEECLKGNVT